MTPEDILRGIYERAEAASDKSVIPDLYIRERANYVCRCMSNRAGVRLLMSCLLGKLDKPNVDPRKPYTEIGDSDSFSGRTYDEQHLAPFINDTALAKIIGAPHRIDNYLFVTTDAIDPKVAEYAAGFYEQTDGVEIAILDCIGFLRHFLHLFHRIRADYLNAYQELVLNEPDSAVSQTLKEAFLALRQAAESDE